MFDERVFDGSVAPGSEDGDVGVAELVEEEAEEVVYALSAVGGAGWQGTCEQDACGVGLLMCGACVDGLSFAGVGGGRVGVEVYGAAVQDPA